MNIRRIGVAPGTSNQMQVTAPERENSNALTTKSSTKVSPTESLAAEGLSTAACQALANGTQFSWVNGDYMLCLPMLHFGRPQKPASIMQNNWGIK